MTKEKFPDKPFCDNCSNSDESMSFSTNDVIQELEWALRCAKTGKSPHFPNKSQSVKNYLEDRIDEIKSDEADAKECENCEKEAEREEEQKPVKVEFT